jgi:hypothetical protein
MMSVVFGCWQIADLRSYGHNTIGTGRDRHVNGRLISINESRRMATRFYHRTTGETLLNAKR